MSLYSARSRLGGVVIFCTRTGGGGFAATTGSAFLHAVSGSASSARRKRRRGRTRLSVRFPPGYRRVRRGLEGALHAWSIGHARSVPTIAATSQIELLM